MVILTDAQEEDLRIFVNAVFNSVEVAVAGDGSTSSLIGASIGLCDVGVHSCWEGFTTSPLTPLQGATLQFSVEMVKGNLDRHGLLALGKPVVLDGIRSAITTPGNLSRALAGLLSFERLEDEKVVRTTSLRHYVDAGLALGELRELDPNYNLVKAGIAAMLNKPDAVKERACSGGPGVVDVLKNTIGRVFTCA
jgi:hypothetical protein